MPGECTGRSNCIELSEQDCATCGCDWDWEFQFCRMGTGDPCSYHTNEGDCWLCGCQWEEPPPALNVKVNIANVWKDGIEGYMNIAVSWKDVAEIWQNIGNVWKRVF